MDKLYAMIQKTPMSQKAALMAMAVFLLSFFYYFFVYQGQQETLAGLEREFRKVEDELQEKQEIASNLSKFKKKVEFLQQKLEEKKKNLPDDANIDQLLKTLNELSEKSDIRILNFVPMAETMQNFYAEIPVNLQIEGNYHEISTFLDKVSKEDRIINLSDISLATPTVRSGKIILQAKCQAKTFRALPTLSADGGRKP